MIGLDDILIARGGKDRQQTDNDNEMERKCYEM